jgi:hypothetical protein
MKTELDKSLENMIKLTIEQKNVLDQRLKVVFLFIACIKFSKSSSNIACQHFGIISKII